MAIIKVYTIAKLMSSPLYIILRMALLEILIVPEVAPNFDNYHNCQSNH